MDSQIEIAVIIPVYNAEKFIADCLDSLIAQTFANWRAYVVNDGSSDSTPIILEDYSVKDQRIKVFHKTNGGVASARNYALDVIGTEQWVSFVDADDYISPYLLEEVMSAILYDNRDVEYVRLFPKRTETRYSEIVPYSCKTESGNGNRIVSSNEYFLHENVGGYAASLFVKAGLIKINHIRFVESMKFLEDQVFSIECAIHANSIMIHQGDCYYYYSNPQSVSRSSSDRSNDIIQCINRVHDLFSQMAVAYLDVYYTERFMPTKIRMLINERIKHFVSKPRIELYSSFTITDFHMPTIEVIKFLLLRGLKRI